MRFAVSFAILMAASLPGGAQEAVFPPLPGETPADEIVDVTPVPIEGLRRVTRADGNVFYVSEDNRWVITGEVIDMWTGMREHELSNHDRMRWERTGTSIQEIRMEGWGADKRPEAVIFLTQQCANCDEAASLFEERRAAPAPYGPIEAWGQWGWIWCHDAVGLDILAQWRQNVPENGIQTVRCKKEHSAAQAVALAQVFDMDPKQPVLIDRQGQIRRGEKEIARWAEQQTEYE